MLRRALFAEGFALALCTACCLLRVVNCVLYTVYCVLYAASYTVYCRLCAEDSALCNLYGMVYAMLCNVYCLLRPLEPRISRQFDEREPREFLFTVSSQSMLVPSARGVPFRFPTRS